MTSGADPADLDELLAALAVDGDAVVVPVAARPGARREGLAGVHAGALKVSTSAAPEGGKATKRLGELLARALGVPRSAVTCVSGATSRHKRYRVAGLDVATCADRLREALA